MCPCDRSDFLTGNFNRKFCSTCCAFRINDDFWLPRSFKSLYSRFSALLTLVVTSGCRTGYCGLRIFISFVKLMVVINITEQSNVTSQNGSCASDSLTLVFLNFLRFYCRPRSLESLYVSFPVLLNLLRGLSVVIHTAIGLSQKYLNTLCCLSKILH